MIFTYQQTKSHPLGYGFALTDLLCRGHLERSWTLSHRDTRSHVPKTCTRTYDILDASFTDARYPFERALRSAERRRTERRTSVHTEHDPAVQVLGADIQLTSDTLRPTVRSSLASHSSEHLMSSSDTVKSSNIVQTASSTDPSPLSYLQAQSPQPTPPLTSRK